MLFDIIPAEWAAAFVTGLVSYIGAKLWGKASDKQKQILDAAVAEARSVITQLVYTAYPDTTVEQIISYAKGALAIQLAKHDIDTENPLIKSLSQMLVAEGVQLFVERHPTPTSLKPPVVAKINTIDGGK